MAETRITFLGAAAAVPGAGEETASFLINGELLIDCGWCAVLRMQQYGFDPLAVRTLYFTHCHHDHYMGLPALLFYRAMRFPRNEAPPALTIVGPPDDLPKVVELSYRFLQADRFPELRFPTELRPLEPGDTYETEGYRIETIRALHPVTGVCSRLTDKRSGAVVAFSGDTGPNPALPDLARGADLLIHEASLRPDTPASAMRGDHSRAVDAAEVAMAAGVKQLALIHVPGSHRDASLATARTIFPSTILAAEGLALNLSGDFGR